MAIENGHTIYVPTTRGGQKYMCTKVSQLLGEWEVVSPTSSIKNVKRVYLKSL